MGFNIQTWDFVHRALGKIGREITGLNMCELGNQHIRPNVKIKFKTAKEYFISLGIKHTSIDLNGYDGSLKLDLSKPIDFQYSFARQFDIITNMGTTEHIGDQYNCFRNIHNLCKVGGMFIHAVPLVGHWMDAHHRGAYHYTLNFFKHLAHRYRYKILICEIAIRAVDNSGKLYLTPKKDDTICVAMVKGFDENFGSKKQFNQLLQFVQLATEGSGMDDQYGKNG